jgi:hypothetical protein
LVPEEVRLGRYLLVSCDSKKIAFEARGLHLFLALC